MANNLISSFIRIVTAGDASLADAIRAMNAALGTKYINSRLREWERGARYPAPDVVNYMLGIVMNDLLKKEGLNNSRIKSVINQCSLPSPK